jgi:hypothetical protein
MTNLEELLDYIKTLTPEQIEYLLHLAMELFGKAAD